MIRLKNNLAKILTADMKNVFWKEIHPPLDTNKSGRLGLINNLLHNLKCNNQKVEKVNDQSITSILIIAVTLHSLLSSNKINKK